MKVGEIYVISDKAGFDGSATRNYRYSKYLSNPFRIKSTYTPDVEEIELLDETLQAKFEKDFSELNYDYVISGNERKYFSLYSGPTMKEGFDALFEAGYTVRVTAPSGSYRAFEDKETMDEFVVEFANTVNYQALERAMSERHRIEREELIAKFGNV